MAASPAAVVAAVPAAPIAVPAPAPTPLLHQALRASVEATNEAGVFRVKLLAANEAAPLAGHEAFLVLVDPKASLLRA
jgi:hypothetical protein